jgi:carbonic anhydrase
VGASLILVLGHESCGAVTAVFQGKIEGIESIAELMSPAVDNSKDLEQALKNNVKFIVNHLKKTPIIKKLIEEKKVECVGAYYHLGSGKVEIL